MNMFRRVSIALSISCGNDLLRRKMSQSIVALLRRQVMLTTDRTKLLNVLLLINSKVLRSAYKDTNYDDILRRNPVVLLTGFQQMPKVVSIVCSRLSDATHQCIK